ncbi:Eukaryotic translation initiation factor 3 subunit A [Capsicum annuum]|nr:Eukaryotic translation initiation factor 3 subunit A [Capsicum annuum]KAF3652517.1 Eukaryotic translation initiation factor 3 subunit A [Capsicum annuum]
MAIFARPENALKHAEDLINGDGQKQEALQKLYDLIISRSYRPWGKTLGRIMLKYVELCVDTRNWRFARDVLIQYRTVCQRVNINSLEEVIKHFMHLANARAELAGNQAQALVDLEADIYDRKLVNPWFKFLWETYKTVLEISRYSSRLESLYAMTAHRAFQFCKQYKLTTEFSRLCEIIRSHLVNLNMYRDQRDRPDLSAPESLHLYLDTRFEQLKVATELSLWQEAFRSIEDIYGLMCMVKKTSKASFMLGHGPLSLPIQWVEDNVKNHIVNETHARSLWYKLETFYASKTGNNKLFLLKQLMNIREGRNKYRDSNDRDKSRSKSRSKFKNVTCDYCNKKGHIMKYCYKHKRDIRRQKKEGDNENCIVVVANDDLLVACGESVINLVCDESSWFVDSGAISHVTPKKKLFSSYTSGNFWMLKMGNNNEVKVLFIGTICLESNNGSKLVLNNVKHAPDVRLNLISVGSLDDEGYVNTLGASQWKLTRGSMIVARGDKPLVERQTGKKLKCIRSDNDGEYIGPFDRYCTEHGIRHRKTSPKIPQLNDLAERMNRTLGEKVRCMFSDVKLSDSFWAEALNTVVYVINLSPTIALNGDVPNRDERSKLDVKTRQCIFIGYDQDEFGYRFYDPVEKKLVKSRDVVFFEDQIIKDFDKSEKVDSQSSESLVDVDLVSLTTAPEENLHDDENQVDNEDDDHVQNDQQEVVDALVQVDMVDQQPVVDAPESSLR